MERGTTLSALWSFGGPLNYVSLFLFHILSFTLTKISTPPYKLLIHDIANII